MAYPESGILTVRNVFKGPVVEEFGSRYLAILESSQSGKLLSVEDAFVLEAFGLAVPILERTAGNLIPRLTDTIQAAEAKIDEKTVLLYPYYTLEEIDIPLKAKGFEDPKMVDVVQYSTSEYLLRRTGGNRMLFMISRNLPRQMSDHAPDGLADVAELMTRISFVGDENTKPRQINEAALKMRNSVLELFPTGELANPTDQFFINLTTGADPGKNTGDSSPLPK